MRFERVPGHQWFVQCSINFIAISLGAVVGAVVAGCGGGDGIDEATVPPAVVFPETAVVLHQEATTVPIEVNENNDEFGTSYAVGDFNCDTRPDLAVGVPGETNSGLSKAGGVAVFLWSDSAPPSMPYVNGPFLRRGQIATTGAIKQLDQFGYSLAATRLDDDNCDDLVIGIPGADGTTWADRGAVQVRYGGGAGAGVLATTGAEFAVLTAIDAGGQSSDSLGFSLSVGRFNGSSAGNYGDFAVGAPNSRDPGGALYGGRVFVCYGGARFAGNQNIATNQRCTRFDSRPLATPSGVNQTRFGYALAAANFDADEDAAGHGLDDLAISAPSLNAVKNGRVYLRPGAEWGVQDAASAARYLAISPPFTNETFGRALATGDLQNDGAPELIVGSSRASGGSVHIYGHEVFDPELLPAANMPSALVETFNITGLDMRGYTACPGCPFGVALATGDFNGDILDDIAVGIPTSSTGLGGFVATRFGAPLGCDYPTSDEGYSAVVQVPADANETGDQFGFAMASVDLFYQGENDGSGFDDLVISATWDDFDGATDTGIALVTRPAMGDLDGPLSGVYQGTVVHDGVNSVIRAYLVHEDTDDPPDGEEDLVRLRMWVRSGSFHIFLDDCDTYTEGGTRDAIDEWAGPNSEIAPNGSFPAVEPDFTFGGSIYREGWVHDPDDPDSAYKMRIRPVFSATPSDFDGTFFNHLEIDITEAHLDVTDPDWLYTEQPCGVFEIGNEANHLELDRINPLWEP